MTDSIIEATEDKGRLATRKSDIGSNIPRHQDQTRMVVPNKTLAASSVVPKKLVQPKINFVIRANLTMKEKHSDKLTSKDRKK